MVLRVSSSGPEIISLKIDENSTMIATSKQYFFYYLLKNISYIVENIGKN